MEPTSDSGTSRPRDTSEALREQQEWLRVTLASIGDAVITTDTQGRVTFLNPVAQSLTGWTLEETRNVSLDSIFKIINEETRRTVENPAIRALREGLVVGLANHTVLIARDGTERPIEDSAAPIRNAKGEVGGVVLVFRDVTERRKAEQALRLSEERFRLLVEGVEDYAIFMLDPQGNVAGWNVGAERIKGYRANEIVGKHFSRFYPPEAIIAGWPEKELQMAAAQGRFEDEGWRVRKDGSKFWANVVITALRDEVGNLKGFSKITRDLTQRKLREAELRDSEVRYRRLFEAARDGVLILDAESRQIIDANPFISELLGYSRDELCGKELWQIGVFEDADASRDAYRLLQEQGYIRYDDLPLQTRKGQVLEVEFVSNVYPVDHTQVIQCNIREITGRRQLERAKLQAEALADLNRRKDEFLAMLSHELRNPLSPILNAVHLLRLQKDDDAIQQQAKVIIERQVGKLTRLVDDLLEVSRITTGRIRLQREQIDLRGIAERALETVRALIEQRGHELVASLSPEPIWLEADSLRMEQVIVNLLTNAAKYTGEGGRIALIVQQEGEEAVVRVRDSGVGIPPDVLPHIFDLFTQADKSLDRSEGGLGVGLTIVQRIAEIHGGRVEAHSKGLGHGSEFVVRLPITLPPSIQPELTPAKSSEKVGSILRVLVVDDNRDSADTIAMLLARSGHDVRVAYSATTALDEAVEFHPDAAVLDIGLPEMDGYEVARRLRQNPQLQNVRLIALSGYGQEADRQRSREEGFDSHMVKPVDSEKLEELLQSMSK
ncbi:MAG TPA: PAS domain S-box protein [Blastocatellia bacterium]|nr:PAS domain S-box protein [Blastocatellia bacterium]